MRVEELRLHAHSKPDFTLQSFLDTSGLELEDVYAGSKSWSDLCQDAGIATLPAGPDTVLSRQFNDGQDLSGGQWQRMGIARGMYRDAAVLVADEPTAALDAKAEARVFEGLREATARRTTILVTHRLANIRNADGTYTFSSTVTLNGGDANDRLGGGSEDVGLVMAAGGVGAIVAALVAALTQTAGLVLQIIGAGEETGIQEAAPAKLELDPAEVQGLFARLSSLAKPSRLLAVFDVSGSMQAENRIGLVKSSLGLLLGRLKPTDKVGPAAGVGVWRMLTFPAMSTRPMALFWLRVNHIASSGPAVATITCSFPSSVSRIAAKPGEHLGGPSPPPPPAPRTAARWTRLLPVGVMSLPPGPRDDRYFDLAHIQSHSSIALPTRIYFERDGDRYYARFKEDAPANSGGE